jgi:hypothetical protein
MLLGNTTSLLGQTPNLDDIPTYRKKYKYLRTVLLIQYLTPEPHLRYLGKKADYQTHRLAPLRHHLDFKFSSNLFKMLVLPGIRLYTATVELGRRRKWLPWLDLPAPEKPEEKEGQ